MLGRLEVTGDDGNSKNYLRKRTFGTVDPPCISLGFCKGNSVALEQRYTTARTPRGALGRSLLFKRNPAHCKLSPLSGHEPCQEPDPGIDATRVRASQGHCGVARGTLVPYRPSSRARSPCMLATQFGLRADRLGGDRQPGQRLRCLYSGRSARHRKDCVSGGPSGTVCQFAGER